ncbi:hypothetical protein [Wolbachia endosymbiont of Ctenocephalides felis wCfeT]|uniref:hypothetical protein n=1 Tax=Wolbachia endosymbiont of Ctenocephalides felis wCfeT TaxID=2732593 RepID=UPI0014483A15|nr:hypothetical protein [Wolbachia endosymbiont of Ctenocephalides felis wCfeT]
MKDNKIKELEATVASRDDEIKIARDTEKKLVDALQELERALQQKEDHQDKGKQAVSSNSNLVHALRKKGKKEIRLERDNSAISDQLKRKVGENKELKREIEELKRKVKENELLKQKATESPSTKQAGTMTVSSQENELLEHKATQTSVPHEAGAIEKELNKAIEERGQKKKEFKNLVEQLEHKNGTLPTSLPSRVANFFRGPKYFKKKFIKLQKEDHLLSKRIRQYPEIANNMEVERLRVETLDFKKNCEKLIDDLDKMTQVEQPSSTDPKKTTGAEYKVGESVFYVSSPTGQTGTTQAQVIDTPTEVKKVVQAKQETHPLVKEKGQIMEEFEKLRTQAQDLYYQQKDGMVVGDKELEQLKGTFKHLQEEDKSLDERIKQEKLGEETREKIELKDIWIRWLVPVCKTFIDLTREKLQKKTQEAQAEQETQQVEQSSPTDQTEVKQVVQAKQETHPLVKEKDEIIKEFTDLRRQIKHVTENIEQEAPSIEQLKGKFKHLQEENKSLDERIKREKLDEETREKIELKDIWIRSFVPACQTLIDLTRMELQQKTQEVQAEQETQQVGRSPSTGQTEVKQVVQADESKVVSTKTKVENEIKVPRMSVHPDDVTIAKKQIEQLKENPSLQLRFVNYLMNFPGFSLITRSINYFMNLFTRRGLSVE